MLRWLKTYLIIDANKLFKPDFYTGEQPSPNVAPFFIEAGAMDGELISNTLYLELKYNWTGLLVEPNPSLADKLIKKGRNAWIFPHCFSPTKSPVVVDFDAMAEYGGIINIRNGEAKIPGTINSNTSSGYLGPDWRKTIKVNKSSTMSLCT